MASSCRCFRVGVEYDLGNSLASLLLAEGRAEPVPLDGLSPPIPFSPDDPFTMPFIDRRNPPNLVIQRHPPYVERDVAAASPGLDAVDAAENACSLFSITSTERSTHNSSSSGSVPLALAHDCLPSLVHTTESSPSSRSRSFFATDQSGSPGFR